MTKSKFAVFDIDGTLARTSLFSQVVHQLIEKNVLPQKQKKELSDKYSAYQNRTHKDAFREYNRFIVDILVNNLTKIKESDFRRAVDDIIPSITKHSYVYTRELIAKLRRENYFLIALSGSEMYTVKQFTKHYDFDIAVGEVYEVKNGFFTGEIKQVVYKKDHFLREFVAQHDLTYKDSVGIGDSMGDASMLEMVERPITFNPEARLYDLARSKGWSIVVERKNVMYELEYKDGAYVLA